MRFIHIADIHASRERLPQTLHILNTLTERAKQGDIDFIIFAGDFWDSTITATKGSGFSDIVSAVRELEKHTNLYFIYGTPTHEPNGSLDAFASDKTLIFNSLSLGTVFDPYCEFIMIPEPRRSDFITSSSAETNEAINKHVSDFINEIGKSDSPRIVVYHGEVKGAVYQNGMSASSPTAIPKELLQSLNADYYALGHIHMPQEVFKNAWYVGSACPKDFGEIHSGAYNLVTIENGETKVERIDFGLPTFETLEFSSLPVDVLKTPILQSDFSKRNLRIKFNCTKEEKKSLNLKQLADEIKEKTNAISVKLEPAVIETENAPKSEVVKRKSLVDKMTEYAKEQSLKIPKYTKELLQNLQDNTLIKYNYPQHSFELLSISLRGAIGIRDGQHKEDFELDFEKYDDGVVCLVGSNGRGKTTLIENCHPYPCMLTRGGTLKENFYLKDSHRILTYRDENGLYYKISMLIDGKTKLGKTSYFVETSKDRKNWTPVPEVDGTLEPYRQWVESTFGSIAVFLRTAFFAKEQTKGTPDISSTTKSERMELLSKLAGTDHLKEVSVIAREQRKEIENQKEKKCAEIGSYLRYDDMIDKNKKDIIEFQGQLKTVEYKISSEEKEIAALKLKDAEYQKIKAVHEANIALYSQYKKEFDEKQEYLEQLNKCVSHRDIYEKITEFRKKIKGNTSMIEKNEPLLEDKLNKYKVLSKELLTLDNTLSKKNIELEKTEGSITLCESHITDIDDICPTCGQPISDRKRKELQTYVDRETKKLVLLQEKEDSLEKEIAGLEDNISSLDDEAEQLNSDAEKIKKTLEKLKKEKDECASYIQRADRLYTDLTYKQVCNEASKIKANLDDLQSKMDKITDLETSEDVTKELKASEEKLKQNLNLKAGLEASIKAAEKENERYKNELESVNDKKKELKELDDKINAYLFIENAFSNNGIPAIELRESAPEISDITNKILSESYGNKFTVRFGSTSELKSNRKANEDFNILVFDSDNDDEKTIDLVSSGERIWIKQALFYAFSIVQMNRTGFNFRTRLIDESDGSLDGALRPKYLNMVTSAHKAAQNRITVLITHSQEIKDVAPQIIEM